VGNLEGRHGCLQDGNRLSLWCHKEYCPHCYGGSFGYLVSRNNSWGVLLLLFYILLTSYVSFNLCASLTYSGLIVAVILTQAITTPTAEGKTQYSVFNGYCHLAAGLCCGISCLAAGGTIGIIGEVGVVSFGMKASGGKRAWSTGEGTDGRDGGDVAGGNDRVNAEDANKLYVGLLIMLIFSEALALYGLIVALILSQKSYTCEE